MRKKIPRHLFFLGKRWNYQRKRIVPELEKGGTVGYCEAPRDRRKRIVVDPRLTDRMELEFNLHEFLHACFWQLSETAIATAAYKFSIVLWERGYRKNSGPIRHSGLETEILQLLRRRYRLLDLDELKRAAGDLATALTRLGYRKQKG